MNTIKEVRLTRAGYERLERNLLQEQQRLVEATRILQEQMETSSDAEDTGLEDAKREKQLIEARIDELEYTLSRAKIIEGSQDKGTAQLGAVVVLMTEKPKKEMTMQLVSAPEATVLSGDIPRISEESPVGRELKGRKQGESFIVVAGNGRTIEYTVKSISYDS